jgi:xanthine/uracil/vitamin C permease (AzgA family)
MSQSDAEYAKAQRLAKLFDLRMFIGSLFVIFGVLVTFTGLTATPEEIEKAAGVNLSLWVGIILLITGAGFVAWATLAPPQVVRGHEVTEEDVPEQMRPGH